MTLHTLSYLVHVGLGSLALLTFWTSGLSRKGSPVHRTSGKLYLLAMTGLLLAAVPLPWLVYPGGVALIASCVWLEWNLVVATRNFARFSRELEERLAAEKTG